MMECAECRASLNALVDNELMADEAEGVRAHLTGCRGCTQEAEEIAATSRLLREGLARYQAPDMLKARLRSAIAAAEASTGPGVIARTAPAAEQSRQILTSRWIRFAAAGLMIAAASSLATYGLVRARGPNLATRDEILASHIRSLMPGHLTDVASTNQHNVKPWFNGRVDLSPLVPGLDSSGFVLDGGRLDYVGGRTVAAVVYMRRQHIINVFSWPDPGGDTGPSVVTTQGYHLVSWRSNSIAFWAVSDLNTAELSQFVAIFQRGSVDVQR